MLINCHLFQSQKQNTSGYRKKIHTRLAFHFWSAGKQSGCIFIAPRTSPEKIYLHTKFFVKGEEQNLFLINVSGLVRSGYRFIE